MKFFSKPASLICLVLALLLSLLLKPVAASSLLDSRVNQLEYQVRSLQTQLSQIQSRSPNPGLSNNRPAPTEIPTIPGELSPDQQFDNLAILVIELKRQVNALEAKVAEISP